jgi:hypothetical protein
MAKQRTSRKSVIREIVADQINLLVERLERAVRGMVAAEAREHFARTSGRRKNIVPCVAPRCGKPSKGPRFHFLCEDHLNAPRRDYMKWRERAKSKRE